MCKIAKLYWKCHNTKYMVFLFRQKLLRGPVRHKLKRTKKWQLLYSIFLLSLKIYYGCSNLVNKYEMTFPHSFSNWFFNSFNLKKILFWSMSSLMLCSYFFIKCGLLSLSLTFQNQRPGGTKAMQTDRQIYKQVMQSSFGAKAEQI